MRNIIKILILITLQHLCLQATILNTKHNLSVSGSGNIKATNETEVCIFCHTPHNALQVKPLWNKKMSESDYTMYSSVFIDRINYPKSSTLGRNSKEPGIISRQCLSCHDGTVAVGSLYTVRGTVLGDNLIDMQGIGDGGVISSNLLSNFGTDLSTHHPVGYEYNPNVSVNFDDGIKTSELKPTPDAPIKTYNYNGKKYIECSSCHDPHTENKMFLRENSGANFGQNVRNTCIACHDKYSEVSWPTTHEVIGMPYRDKEVFNKYGTYNPSDLFCINCHTPHNSKGSSLLRKVEQQSCFQGAASSSAVSSCHGTGAPSSAPDIESVLNKSYGHPTIEIDKVHTNLDVLYGTGVARNPSGSKGLSWDDSKHAECSDCHNPHKLGSKNHVNKGEWYPSSPSNVISQVLRGTSGVEPVWTVKWSQPTTFNLLKSSTKEYQICLKCHSYWALGNAIDGVSPHTLAREGINATDQAWEFNPNNRSAHPVVVALNSMPGSYEPKALKSQQMNSPWKSVGTQTMYCSDCHGSDNEIGGDPKGPHGSSYKFMLKGENTYWPEKPDGTLYTVGDIFNGGDDGLFCKNCHNLSESEVHQSKGNNIKGNGNGEEAKFKDFTCVNCHVAVPHGAPVSRLIGYNNFPEPYNYNGNSLKLDGFKKGTSLDVSNAHSTDAACKCHGEEGMEGKNYDSFP